MFSIYDEQLKVNTVMTHQVCREKSLYYRPNTDHFSSKYRPNTDPNISSPLNVLENVYNLIQEWWHKIVLVCIFGKYGENRSSLGLYFEEKWSVFGLYYRLFSLQTFCVITGNNIWINPWRVNQNSTIMLSTYIFIVEKS